MYDSTLNKCCLRNFFREIFIHDGEAELNGNLKLHLLDKMLVSGVNSNIAHQTSKEKNVGHDTISAKVKKTVFDSNNIQNENTSIL